MKSLFQISSVVLISVLAHACKNAPVESFHSGNKMADDRFTLTAKKIIEIPIDSTSANWSPYPVYFTNDTCELYITANEYSNSIDFYDLDQLRLIKRNTFQKVGPSGVRSTRKIYLKSLDSIYLYSDDDRKILLTDFEGNILRSYNVAKHPGTVYMVNLLQPFTVSGRHAYFGHMAFGGNRAQVGYSTMIRLDLETDLAEPFGADYPILFGQYIYYNFMPYYTFGHDKNIVVRYGSLPDIYNYDVSSDSTYVIPMRSSSQDKDIVPNKEAYTTSEVDRDFEQIVQGQYTGIFYDKYRNVYYSVFLKGLPVNDSDGNKHDHMDLPVSIIIFNEDFEYCGEVALERNTYFNNFICTKKGLLIPMSHPNNPDTDESILRFQVFALEKDN